MSHGRRLVLVAIGSGAALVLVGRLGLGAPEAARTLFREVPPEESRIDWVHENALSPQRYLPETTGAGAAIFDFDNDGWMDVYLVNSGPCDLYRPGSPCRTPSTGTTGTARSPT